MYMSLMMSVMTDISHWLWPCSYGVLKDSFMVFALETPTLSLAWYRTR